MPRGGSPSRGAFGTKVLVFLAFFVLVAVFTVGIWGLATILASKQNGAAGPDNLVEHWETPAERLENISQAMAASEPGCSGAERRDLQRFFARLESALHSGDEESWRKCVDLNLLVQRIAAHPVAQADRSFRSSRIKSRLDYELTPLELAGRLSILRVERGKRDDHLLVYTLDEGYDEQLYVYRWWLARSGRQWRLFDYDRIDYGQSLAGSWAMSDAIAADPNQYNYTRLYEAIDAVSETHLAGPRYVRADSSYGSTLPGQPLFAVADLPQPELVHDLTRLDLAWQFFWQNEPRDALRMCQQVERPEECAGVYLVRAQAARNLNQFEQSLAAAQEYANLVGETPDALAELARALEHLKRPEEAAEKWLRVLQKAPDCDEALDEFLRLARRGQFPALREVLLRSREPQEKARRYAENALTFDRYAAHEWLIQFVHQEAPGSALDLSLEGALLESLEEYEAAADRFLKASQLEWLPAKQEAYFNRYLRTMVDLGQGGQAFRAAADPKESFELLANDLEEELEYQWEFSDLDKFGPVIAAYRECMPADPRGDYYAGIILLRAHRWAEAEVCFEQAAGKDADEWLSQQITERRAEAGYRRGNMLPSYHKLGRTSEVFHALAGVCHQDEAWPALRELITEHRLHQPNDAWIDYYLALEAAGREAYGEAAEALARAKRAGGEEFDLAWLRNHYLVEAGEMHEALQQADDREGTFVQIASQLESRGEWRKLLRLAELPAAANLSTQKSRRLLALFELGKYYDFLEAARPQIDEAFHKGVGFDPQLFANTVRAQLRVGQFDEARELAARVQQERGDRTPQVMVLLAERNFEALRELLEDETLVESLLASGLHHDPELESLLMSLELADVRRGWTLPVPYEVGSGRLVLWLRDFVPFPTAAALENDLMQAASTDVDAVPIPRAVGSSAASFRLATSRGTMIVTFGAAPYQDCHPAAKGLSAELSAACDQAGSWIAIDFPRPAPGLRGEILETWACRLVCEWARSPEWGENSIVAIGGYRNGHHRLATMKEETMEELRRGEFLARGSGAELYDLEVFDTDRTRRGDLNLLPPPARREARAKLVDDLFEGNPPHLEFACELMRGAAVERVWLQGIRAENADYYTLLEGRMLSDSQLWPHLTAGTIVEIGMHELRAIREPAEPVSEPTDPSQ
ncbi:MAG: hypothetical protein MUF06_00380 [Pirellulaceae bacterium]|nr:hypothetical protein [Pirellulaceae bacterium]